ncbi:GFA family protein [Ottowia sp.]|uniref:GFA family protein n=1 Tax=Ottowia sp. TaxID=1898956 RepID=UPI0025D1AF43|nr:GFA family protein [Ottowia sp.]MBK6616713.1 GFA family protein [Ottowia sp.]
MSMVKGSCLCGEVQYEVDAPFLYAGYCHCSECRKFSGSPFSAIGGVQREAFRLTRGDGKVGQYRKSQASLMHFCNACGSSLFVEKTQVGLLHVRLGTLDESHGVRPQAHVHVASKASWFDIPNDGLPRFDGEAPGIAAATRVSAAASAQ